MNICIVNCTGDNRENPILGAITPRWANCVKTAQFVKRWKIFFCTLNNVVKQASFWKRRKTVKSGRYGLFMVGGLDVPNHFPTFQAPYLLRVRDLRNDFLNHTQPYSHEPLFFDVL